MVLPPITIIISAADFNIKPLKWALILPNATLTNSMVGSVAFGKMSAHFRGLMLKSAALIMIVMGGNTIYMGLSFYVADNFQQHNFIHDIKNEIDAVILFLRQMVDYYAGMIKNSQGQ